MNNRERKNILGGFRGVPSLKNQQKEMLYTELASLISSGLDFSRSFQLLIDTETKENAKALLKAVFNDIITGLALWEALQKSRQFTALDVGVVKIGEQTGKLEDSLRFLADYYNKKIEQKRMITSAVSYPLVILSTAVIVVIFMLMVIVPMFEQVYARMGGQLPELTRWIIGFSKSFPAYFSIFGVMAASGFLFIYAFRQHDSVRRFLSNVVLSTPIVGAIVRKNSQANFCKLLYLLISSGVPLLTSIQMLGTVITLYPYQQSLLGISAGLCRGELFSDNLSSYPKLYDIKLTMLLTVGEQTNRLPEMLNSQGQEITRDIEHRIRQMGSLLEPMLIIVVGCLVAVVLISMYLPMFRLGGIIE